MTRAAIISLLIIVAFGAGAPGAAIVQQTGERRPAPAFELKDLDGKTARLSDYRGKVLLINFWATWCPPCRAEMPDLVRLQEQYGARGLQIVGVTHPPQSVSTVRIVTRRLKVNYPVLLGSRELAEGYGVDEVLPVTIIVDREGNIRDRILGILEREEFDQKILPLLQ
jgi:peroxiredoxin